MIVELWDRKKEHFKKLRDVESFNVIYDEITIYYKDGDAGRYPTGDYMLFAAYDSTAYDFTAVLEMGEEDEE